MSSQITSLEAETRLTQKRQEALYLMLAGYNEVVEADLDNREEKVQKYIDNVPNELDNLCESDESDESDYNPSKRYFENP